MSAPPPSNRRQHHHHHQNHHWPLPRGGGLGDGACAREAISSKAPEDHGLVSGPQDQRHPFCHKECGSEDALGVGQQQGSGNPPPPPHGGHHHQINKSRVISPGGTSGTSGTWGVSVEARLWAGGGGGRGRLHEAGRYMPQHRTARCTDARHRARAARRRTLPNGTARHNAPLAHLLTDDPGERGGTGAKSRGISDSRPSDPDKSPPGSGPAAAGVPVWYLRGCALVSAVCGNRLHCVPREAVVVRKGSGTLLSLRSHARLLPVGCAPAGGLSKGEKASGDVGGGGAAWHYARLRPCAPPPPPSLPQALPLSPTGPVGLPDLPPASAGSDMIGWSRVLLSHTLDAARSY